MAFRRKISEEVTLTGKSVYVATLNGQERGLDDSWGVEDFAISYSLFDLSKICFRFLQFQDIFVRRLGLEATRKEAVCEEEGD